MRIIAGSVSYTHLDVYKRQLPDPLDHGLARDEGEGFAGKAAGGKATGEDGQGAHRGSFGSEAGLIIARPNRAGVLRSWLTSGAASRLDLRRKSRHNRRFDPLK